MLSFHSTTPQSFGGRAFVNHNIDRFKLASLLKNNSKGLQVEGDLATSVVEGATLIDVTPGRPLEHRAKDSRLV